jgi:hypothetical protein
MSELTVFSIATDRYLAFWVQLIESAIVYLEDFDSVHWVICTNKSADIPTRLLEQLGSNLTIVEIEHEKWPFPTLLRFRYILEASSFFVGKYFLYLDADMKFVNKVNLDFLVGSLGQQELLLTEHPGFYRPPCKHRIALYLLEPRMVFSDLLMYLRFGGLGSWCRDKKSLAYVPRKKRKKYVCGGVWFGKKSAILNLSSQLALRIDQDLVDGVIAPFHDESHLNWYFCTQILETIPPMLCFESSYPQLKTITPIISVIDKNEKEQWQRDG